MRCCSNTGWSTVTVRAVSPLNVPAGETRTFAEMTSAEKDARSHRRLAWDEVARRYKDLADALPARPKSYLLYFETGGDQQERNAQT